MNSLRKRLFKSKLYYFPIFAVISGISFYLLSSFLSKAKPIEKFSIFVSGVDFDRETLRERIYSYKTEKYDYILVFEAVTVNENDTEYPYDYRFENEAVTSADLIIYPQKYFEDTYTTDAYKGHFNPIKPALSSWVMPNEYAVKIHDKDTNPKDDVLGITFGDDNYLISINIRTVHDSSSSDAASYFLGAFVHSYE